MFEEQKIVLNKLAELYSDREELEKEISCTQKILFSSISRLVGKCYSQPTKPRFFHDYVVTSKKPYGTYIQELDNVFQIIGVKNNSLIIQQAEEVVNEVTPRDRLTWRMNIYEYDINKFVNSDRTEISVEEYLERIKKMQERDSYVCWKTTLNIK